MIKGDFRRSGSLFGLDYFEEGFLGVHVFTEICKYLHFSLCAGVGRGGESLIGVASLNGLHDGGGRRTGEG